MNLGVPYKPRTVFKGLEVVTPADLDALLPLAEVKKFLRVDASDAATDTEVTSIRDYAINQAQKYTELGFGTQTIKAYYDCIADNELLPLARATTITAITIDDDIQDLANFSLENGYLKFEGIEKYYEGKIEIEYNTGSVTLNPVAKLAILNICLSQYDPESENMESKAYKQLNSIRLKTYI